MTKLALLLSSLAACSVVACSVAGGEEGDGAAPVGTGTTRSYDVKGFTEVSLAGSDDVDVRVGPAFSVRAEGPTEVLDRLRIDRRGDALTVGRKRGLNLGTVRGSAKVFVTLPRITGASVAGSGDLAVDRAEGERFEGSLAGSGNLSVGALGVRGATFNLAGSGDVTAAGRAERLDVSIAGSGNVDARGLRAGSADVSIAGSGDVNAAVNGPATVNLVGSGDADLGPDARCTVHKMGSGSARCAR